MGNSTGSFFGSDWLGAFLIIAVLFGGFGGFGFGGRDSGYATTEYVQSALNNQSTQTGLRDVLLSSANNNYETAQLINGQTNALMQQGYTYQLSAEQRFNTLQQQIAQLGFQMDSCCCAIKTQMLQDKYEQLENLYRTAQNDASNAAQTQLILSTMGKWVANAPAAAA